MQHTRLGSDLPWYSSWICSSVWAGGNFNDVGAIYASLLRYVRYIQVRSTWLLTASFVVSSPDSTELPGDDDVANPVEIFTSTRSRVEMTMEASWAWTSLDRH